MLGHTHIGITLVLTLGVALPVGLNFGNLDPDSAHTFGSIDVAILILGSLAPDLDHPGSHISRPGDLLGPLCPGFFRKGANFFGQVTSRIIRTASPHRGVLHYPLTAIGLGYASYLLKSPILGWFSWAYGCHLLGDFCTRKGIPVFGPFSRRSVEWSPLVTGSVSEKLLSVGLWILVLELGYGYIPLQTRESISENVKTVVSHVFER